MPELPSPAATTLNQPWKSSVIWLCEETMLVLLGKAE